MSSQGKTAIVTGASQGIGAGIAKAFLERGYNVANSRKVTQTTEVTASDRVALVDGSLSPRAQDHLDAAWQALILGVKSITESCRKAHRSSRAVNKSDQHSQE